MIEGYAVGLNEVIARFDRIGEALPKELHAGIGRLVLRLQTVVKQDKLSGQVLGVRTGQGRRSIEQVVVDEGSSVAGIVSTNIPYMIGWETGWPDAGVGASLASAKAKFAVGGSADTFKNGTPKQRSFLRTSLHEFEEQGIISGEFDIIVQRATQ